MNIIISASRFAPEVEKVKETLQVLLKESGLSLSSWGVSEENNTEIGQEHVYFCEDAPTNSQVRKQGDEIDPYIRNADWVIVIAPLNHIGKYTLHEIDCAIKAFYENNNLRNPVLTVFHCTDHNDIQENQTIEKVYDPIKGEEKYSLEDVKRRMGAEISRHLERLTGKKDERPLDDFIEEYKYDSEGEKLINAIEISFKKNLSFNRFPSQALFSMACPGKEIKATDLYYDKNRALPENGFYKEKYFPRASVDGKLKTALDEERKYIILSGASGSGKTRAIYELLTANGNRYAMGSLQEVNVIVLNKGNIKNVYNKLRKEDAICKYLKELSPTWDSEKCVLVCDQIKDVFNELNDNNMLIDFFDLVDKFSHFRLIATSTPSAFNSFCERWGYYKKSPLTDKGKTADIQIPLISADEEGIAFRNWAANEFNAPKKAETVGDYIQGLNDYKENIVKDIFNKAHAMPFLRSMLQAIQITETYRYDTALFLPILIAQSQAKEEGIKLVEFQKGVANVITYLITKNLIWVTDEDGENVEELLESNFDKKYGMDDDEHFEFDGELEPYNETKISTKYRYSINEIVWECLEMENRRRRNSKKEETLIFDFHYHDHIYKSAKLFYSVFPYITTLRRIIPRLPQGNNKDMKSTKNTWKFVFDKCQEFNLKEDKENEKEDLCLTLGMLIGRSSDIKQINNVLNLLKEKGLKPDYNIVGELYSAGTRSAEEDFKKELTELIGKFRNDNDLKGNSFFSLQKMIYFEDLDFDRCFEEIERIVSSKTDEKLTDLEIFNLKILVNVFVKKCRNEKHWKKLLDFVKKQGIGIGRAFMRSYFSWQSEAGETAKKDTNTGYDRVAKLTEDFLKEYSDCIFEENKMSAYYYSVQSANNFREAEEVYELFFEKNGNIDDSKLISEVILRTRNQEFQLALQFLNKAKERMYKRGTSPSVICYNNLIKRAPNIGEAMNIVPLLPMKQEHTLVNILNLIKDKRKIDPKSFFYAYNVIMQDEFRELRRSPHVVGILYNIAITLKNECFIYETILDGMETSKKMELVDYSTIITSLRLKKSYRELNEAWELFDTCRKHYKNQNLYISSDLYANMMRKLDELLNDTPQERKKQLNKLGEIIEEDDKWIIKDDRYVASVYRYMPDKQIIKDGMINEKFIKDLFGNGAEVLDVTVFNNILKKLKDDGFNAMWAFYTFMVDYYKEHGCLKSLQPDIRTITILYEEVDDAVALGKVEEAATKRIIENNAEGHKKYCDARDEARSKYGKMKNDKRKEPENKDQKTFYQQIEMIINSAQTDIDCGTFTSTKLNKCLKELNEIKDCINKDSVISKDEKDTYIKEICRNVYVNIVRKIKKRQLCFDGMTYVSMLKLSTNMYQATKWIVEMNKREKEFLYDVTVCREMAVNIWVARYDIGMSRQYFKNWEIIMEDVGFSPKDENSFSDYTEKGAGEFEPDYDYYWNTHKEHLIREMDSYWQKYIQKEPQGGAQQDAQQRSLKFIHEMINHFKECNKKYHPYTKNNKQIDFEEIWEKECR